jgi:hypothetical protein
MISDRSGVDSNGHDWVSLGAFTYFYECSKCGYQEMFVSRNPDPLRKLRLNPAHGGAYDGEPRSSCEELVMAQVENR